MFWEILIFCLFVHKISTYNNFMYFFSFTPPFYQSVFFFRRIWCQLLDRRQQRLELILLSLSSFTGQKSPAAPSAPAVPSLSPHVLISQHSNTWIDVRMLNVLLRNCIQYLKDKRRQCLQLCFVLGIIISDFWDCNFNISMDVDSCLSTCTFLFISKCPC